MTDFILLGSYIIGIPCWAWFEKKFMPFKAGDYHIDFDGAHEITEDMWRDEVRTRSVMWPVCLFFILVLSPVILLDKLLNKIF